MHWDALLKLSREAFGEAVNNWIGLALILGGNVNGPAATLPPGSLTSSSNVEARMLQTMFAARAPADLARGIARPLSKAWNEWAANFLLVMPQAYPTFAAVPMSVVGDTLALPYSLSSSTTPGEIGLKAPILAHKLGESIKPYRNLAAGGSDAAIKSLADWVENSFADWKKAVVLIGLTGSGPVPTWAPPYSPVGPVVGGTNRSLIPLFAGPRFGRIVG